MPMKNPPHPGEIIRDLYLKPLGLTVTETAAGLGVTRKTFSLLVNGHAGISHGRSLGASAPETGITCLVTNCTNLYE